MDEKKEFGEGEHRGNVRAGLEHMRHALTELEAAARKLQNHNFADLIKGAHGRLSQASEHPDLEKVSEQLKGELNDPKLGPTVAEWVAAGYKARNYPPHGYEPRSTPEEIAAAVAAEGPADGEQKPFPGAQKAVA
jgi:hypothetical protein